MVSAVFDRTAPVCRYWRSEASGGSLLRTSINDGDGGGGSSSMISTLEGGGVGGSGGDAGVSSDDGIKHRHTSAGEHDRS